MRLAITMGDPAGVGPELCLTALAEPAVLAACTPLVFGDAHVLRRCAESLGRLWDFAVISDEDYRSAPGSVTGPAVIDFAAIDPADLRVGEVTAAGGEASFRYIQGAIDAALDGRVAAVTTAPINKESIHAAGHRYPGHTEMFAARCSVGPSCMMQFSAEITCTFVTTHCGYAEVPRLVTRQRVGEVIDLTAAALRKIHRREPRIVVCGLNPHAGERGLFGNREEEQAIRPAIEERRAAGMLIEGPLPGDTAFLESKRRSTDAFVCMYHDQGHIPVKALAFETAVNTTLGLSVVRTSVDHGTAYDIAWQGKANPSSLFAAIGLATRLAALRDAA